MKSAPAHSAHAARAEVTSLPEAMADHYRARGATGAQVTSARDWPARRAELLRTLEYYAVGQAPPAPGNVKGRVVQTQELNGGTAERLGIKVGDRVLHPVFGH